MKRERRENKGGLFPLPETNTPRDLSWNEFVMFNKKKRK